MSEDTLGYMVLLENIAGVPIGDNAWEDIVDTIQKKAREHNLKIETIKGAKQYYSDMSELYKWRRVKSKLKELLGIYEMEGKIVVQPSDVERVKEREGSHECVWEYDKHLDCWVSSCGEHKWQLFDGSPLDNDMKYCPFCSRQLRVEES